jgi:hypothetical protein
MGIWDRLISLEGEQRVEATIQLRGPRPNLFPVNLQRLPAFVATFPP